MSEADFTAEFPDRSEGEVKLLEVSGYHRAVQFVDKIAHNRKQSIDDLTTRQINATLLGDFLPSSAGRYRSAQDIQSDPRIYRESYLPPHHSEVPVLMMKYGHGMKERLGKCGASVDKLPQVIRACSFAHRLVDIHPFEEGNGRTARLMVNLILKRFGWRTITFSLDEKSRYIQALRDVNGPNGIFSFELLLADKLKEKYHGAVTHDREVIKVLDDFIKQVQKEQKGALFAREHRKSLVMKPVHG